jgi:hypothetical protein
MRHDERLNSNDDRDRDETARPASEMASRHPTPAEVTASIILTAAQTGVPLSIPGALDVRVGRPARRAPRADERPAAPERQMNAAPDLERREHEREGGGAPSERDADQHDNLFERLLGRTPGPR